MTKKLGCLVLSVVMCLTLALPSFAAAAKCTITIRPDTYSEADHDDRFVAYQIFTGTVETDVASQNRKLSHITWGDGVKKTELIEALKLDPKIGTEGGFTTWWTDYETSHKNEYANDAVALARFLDDLFKKDKRAEDGYGEDSYWDAFNKAVAAHTNGAGTRSTRETSKGSWTIQVDPGYYLIVDEVAKKQSENHEVSDVASSYILEVIGTREIDVKSSVPTVEKIVEDSTVEDDTTHKGNLEATDSSSHMTFTITGTLPENYKDFRTFKYRFVDTLSAGLTPEIETIQVQVKPHEGAARTIDSSHYTVTPDVQSGWQDGTSSTLTVFFSDLMTADSHITAADSIVLTYQAHLNRYATVGGNSSNDNEVRLQYSNDPYADHEGEVETKDTVPSKTKTFTLGLDITKLNGTSSTGTNPAASADSVSSCPPMKDVQFCLKNSEGHLAVWEKSGLADSTAYKLKEWKTDATIHDDCKVTTDAAGKIRLEGLKEGTYTLVELETSANKGWEKMEDVVFELSADVVQEGTSAKLTATSAKLTDGHSSRQDVAIGDRDSDGIFEMTLLNYEAPVLPHTGGPGVYFLLALGGALAVAGVAVIRVSRKRTSGNP